MRLPLHLAVLGLLAHAASAQTVTVTIPSDAVDIDPTTATVADLPGPDGEVSLSEAFIATNNTPGHQTIAFAIPQNLWAFQFVHPGCAVITSNTGFYHRSTDAVTVDATTQTAFTGDTNPDGGEVVIFQWDMVIDGPGSTVRGFHASDLILTGGGVLAEGNTGGSNIDVFGGSGSIVRDNTCGTIHIDRSDDNFVVGNTCSRVRVNGFGASALATNNRIGGPSAQERNHIVGFGSWNSQGLPSGTLVELQDTLDTHIENNTIGTTPDGLAQGHPASTIGIGFRGQNDGTLVQDNLIAGILGHGQGPGYAGLLFGHAVIFWGLGNGDGVTLRGNTIGLDANGDPTLGSVHGIDVGDAQDSTQTNLTIGGSLPGDGNTIAGHIFEGVVVGRNTEGVRITGNRIHDNGGLGIDLVGSAFEHGVTSNDAGDSDTGGNGLQNFPVLLAASGSPTATTITGTLNSAPSTPYTLEFFASSACDATGFGEGEDVLGRTLVQTDAAGLATFTVTLSATTVPGMHVTATATDDLSGSTSEFSACTPVVAGAEIGVAYCGPAVPNSTGLSAALHAYGSDVAAAGDVTLVATELPPQQTVLFLASRTAGSVANPGGSQGTLCLGGTIGRFNAQVTTADAGGSALLDLDTALLPPPLVGPIQTGDTWHFQAWFRDQNPAQTSNFTDGRQVTFN